MNPFRYGCVVEGENYCPRPDLQRQLRELIKSGQNLVVQGPRRMGKTSLVRETVKSLSGIKLLYVDLFCVRTIGELCRRIVLATAKCGHGRSFLDKVANLVQGLRPVFTLDKDTGAPKITIDIKAAQEISSVEEVMDMVGKISESCRICVVLDEFQDLLDLPDSDVIIARLRSQIQFMPAVPFVFLGSVRNAMHSIFDSPSSPFFKSAINFGVDRIDKDDFIKFLISRFAAGERRLFPQEANRIIELADGISGDVQELSETTWLMSENGATIDASAIDRGLRSVFAREYNSFTSMKSRLTTNQLSVLEGLAKEERVKVFSGEFLRNNNIANIGSVSKAVKRLLNDEYIYEYQGEYRFENPFFKAWLQQT